MTLTSSKLSRGFTLVELLVVIAIIGILATTGLTQLGAARGKARDARRVSDIVQISQAIEAYNEANSVYPPDIADATMAPYISGNKLPRDPGAASPAYSYAVGGGVKYHLWAELEFAGTGVADPAKPRALSSDSDIVSTGGTFTGDLIDGGVEACTTAVTDCIYDVGQK